jgi:hypothetical protein
MIRKILVPVDGSVHASKAIAWARISLSNSSHRFYCYM